jgi:hypothetical protein
VPTLRSDGVNVVLGVFKALCILGGERLAELVVGHNAGGLRVL